MIISDGTDYASVFLVQAISRRKFVTTTAVIAAGVSALGYNSSRKVSNLRGTIRLLPVEGIIYSESFTCFMQRARFDSVRDALASIRDRSLPVNVVHSSAIDHIKPVAMAPNSMVCNTRRTEIPRAAGSSVESTVRTDYQDQL